MFTIQTVPMGDGNQVMVIAQLQVRNEDVEKVKKVLKECTGLPVGEEWILQHAEKKTKTRKKNNA